MKKVFGVLFLILVLNYGFEFSDYSFDSNIIFEPVSILNFEIEPKNEFEISNQNTNLGTCNDFEFCDTIVLTDETEIEIETKDIHYTCNWDECDAVAYHQEDCITMRSNPDWEEWYIIQLPQ